MQQIGAQQSPQGIAALAMGNPAPLQQRVAKGGKDPQTGLPKDLVDALALNIVTNEQDAAKRQMAMSQLQQASGQTGQMPTVVQSLQQQAQQKMQAQAMQARQQQQGLQALMQQAPQGGPVPEGTPQPEEQPKAGIDQLPVNFGMAEGGIVAFAKGGESDEEYETPYDRMNRLNREAEAERDTPESRKDSEGIMKALKFVGGLPVEALKTLVSAPGYGFNKEAAPAAAKPPVQTGTPPMPNAAAAQVAPQGVPQGGPAPAPVVAPQAARPVQAGPGAAPAPQGLNALLDKSIREDLGRDRESEAQKMMGKQREIMGMDEYQKGVAESTAARQAEFDKAKAGRTPDWARGLMALSGAPVRGGIGMMLGKAGSAATTARDEYGAEDLKFSKELMDLKNAAAKAKLDGNTALAKSYTDAYKEVDAARRAAMQSGTSLENVRAQTEATKQRAASDAANRADARADKTDAAYREQAMRMAMAAATKEKALPANMARYKDVTTEALAASMFDRIYNALKTGKMDAAPGAPRPGGTSTSGWGKASVVTP